MRTLTTCSFLNNIGDTPSSIDSPLQLKLINFLGLKNYMIDNFIFRRKLTKYHIRKKQQTSHLFIQDQQYQAPTGYTQSIHIIQTAGNSIPICRLIPKNRTNNYVLIYAHGNGSDLSDSIAFVDRLSQFVHVQFVMFDYTGYGESRVGDVGEEVICRDLEVVLAWLSESVKLSNIILWGFSLGTYPVVVTASKYQLAGIILQCPIASISCLFHTQLQPDMKFKQDHFANIDHITDISEHTKILIMHSTDDEIIPFSHAKILYTKYLMKNGGSNIDFIEIAKIRHNSLHRYIVSAVENQLQKEVFSFLTNVMYYHKNNETIGSLNTENTIKQEQNTTPEKEQPTAGFISLINHPKKLQKKKKNQQLSEQLKNLRMKIIQPNIEDIPGDMHELVVEQQLAKDRKTKIQRVRQKILDSKGKNCFCFPNKL